MLDTVRAAHALARPRWRMLRASRLVDVAALLGGLVLFGVCGYRRLWHPEWSGLQALANLWPLYVIGGAPIVAWWVGWLRASAAPAVSRAGASTPSTPPRREG